MKSGAATPATRQLTECGVAYREHLYDYVEHGGTSVSSTALGVPEHHVVKTLVMETDRGDPLVVLMHGDRKVATKEIARAAGARRVFPARPDAAQRHSGYLVGGTSPFGLRKPVPIYMERSILGLERIYINGGRRGYLLEMDPREVVRVLSPILVDAAAEE
jgi:Cys-tRNA(Pro) deacylase